MRKINFFMLWLMAAIVFLTAMPAHADEIEEAQHLQKSKGLAARHANTLALTLADGTVKILQGCKEKNGFNDDCVEYDYEGLFAQDQFFIITQWYAMDGQTMNAISRKSGTIYDIEGQPYLSPGGDIMLAPLASEADGLNGLHLWAIKNGELEKIAVEGDQEMYEYIRWRDNHNAELKRYTYKDPRVNCGWITTRMLLSMHHNAWQLRELSAPSCR